MIKEINWIFLILAFFAEVIGTIGGFGSSVFFVPIANFYFDFQSVLGLTALFHFSSNLSKIALFRKGIDKRLLLYLGLPSLIMVIIGGYGSAYFNAWYLELLLGIFLIALSSLFIIKKDLVIKAGKKQAVIGGGLSGLMAGILGTGGAIRGLTMAAFNLNKNTFIATSAFIDFFIDFTRTFIYYDNGYIHKHNIKYVPYLFVIGFVGTYTGKYLLKFIPQNQFKRISLALIFLIGIITIAKIIYNS